MRSVSPHAVGEEEYSPLSTAGEIGEKMRSGDARAVGILAEGRQAWSSGTVAVVILTRAISFEILVAQCVARSGGEKASLCEQAFLSIYLIEIPEGKGWIGLEVYDRLGRPSNE
jgi:hypothetical protein